MMAGLGIDFNPPPSPPTVALNPAVAKLRGQQGLGRSLPTERDARLKQNNGEGGHPAAGRRVRIVSAANIYHEQQDQDEDDASDDCAGEDTMDYGEDYDDEDILDDYTQPSPYLGSSPGSAISPAPTSHTMQTEHSTGAVSSGSSARHIDAETMQTMPAMSSKAEEFETRLRNLHIDEYHPDPSLYQLHRRAISTDNRLPPSSVVTTVRGNLPPAASVQSNLRRAPAMSRPKSMMELNHLYAYQSTNSAARDVEPMRLEQPDVRRPLSMHSVSPSPIESNGNCESRSTGVSSTGPTSTYASAELKPSAAFMMRGQSDNHATAGATNIGPSSQELRKARSAISMRSQASMRGLELAEIGGGAVVADAQSGGFLAGIPFDPRHTRNLKSPPVVGADSTRHLERQLRDRATSIATSRLSHAISLPTLKASVEQPLQRQSTLLSAGANSTKRAKELERLLDPKPVAARAQYTAPTQSYNTMQISSQPTFTPGGTSFQSVDATGYQPGKPQVNLKRKPSTVVLEQGVKGKARVEIDLTLVSELIVEGGALRGKMEVKVRKDKDGEGVVWLGSVKARIVGFEGALESRIHNARRLNRMPQSWRARTLVMCFTIIPRTSNYCIRARARHASYRAMSRNPMQKDSARVGRATTRSHSICVCHYRMEQREVSSANKASSSTS